MRKPLHVVGGSCYKSLLRDAHVAQEFYRE